jgi:proteasome accessory factor C
MEPADQVEVSQLLEYLGKGALDQQQLPFAIQTNKKDADLALVRRAVAENRILSCSYRNTSGEISQRQIEPILLESRESNWYLRGFCLTNKEPRVFRLDRMRDIEVGAVVTERRELIGDRDEIYSGSSSDTEVLFEVQPEAFGLIADYKPDYEITGNKSVQVRICIGQLENLGRIVSRYSGKVRVLAPESAKAAVRSFAKKALGHSISTVEAE